MISFVRIIKEKLFLETDDYKYKSLFSSYYRFIMALKDEKRDCFFCLKKFTPKYKPQVCCSRHCSILLRNKNKISKNIIELNCDWCKVSFTKKLSTLGKIGNYCCLNCSQAAKRGHETKYITKTCPNCNNKFDCLFRKQTIFCSKSCSKSGKNHPLYGKKIKQKNKNIWNEGLTKKTDSRLADLGKKISFIQKQQFKHGLRTNKGKNNPNYGTTTSQRTPEQLENYSSAAINRIKNNLIKIRGQFESLKTGKKISFRSSLEKQFIECLEKDSNVIHYEYEPFAIEYEDLKNKKRKYLPDFYVCYNNGEKVVIEIKCDYTETVGNFSQKKKAALDWCEKRKYKFLIFKKFDILNYESKLNE